MNALKIFNINNIKNKDMDAISYLKTCLGTDSIQSFDPNGIAEIMDGFVVHQDWELTKKNNVLQSQLTKAKDLVEIWKGEVRQHKRATESFKRENEKLSKKINHLTEGNEYKSNKIKDLQDNVKGRGETIENLSNKIEEQEKVIEELKSSVIHFRTNP